MELSFASFLRYRNFKLATSSEIFLSDFAITIATGILIFWLSSMICLQTKFKELDSPQFKDKYGSLVLHSNLNSRSAQLYPAKFMLQRAIYAVIIIFMIKFNYFQVLSVILGMVACMVFTGYVRPFDEKFINNLELLNEILTLLATYSLVLFTHMVPDAVVRYDFGWYIIAVTLMTLLINLGVLLGTGIKNALTAFFY